MRYADSDTDATRSDMNEAIRSVIQPDSTSKFKLIKFIERSEFLRIGTVV